MAQSARHARSGGASRTNGGPRMVSNKEFLRDVVTEFAQRQMRDTQQGRANMRQYATRVNASLPERSWTTVDDTVYETQDQTLRLVSDLRSAGLVTQTDILTKIDTWPLVDDEGSARMAMSPEVNDDESAVRFGDDGVPVPVVFDTFSLGFRENPSPDSEATPSAVEDGLDTLGVSTTTRNVNELLESTFIDGWSETINWSGDGYTLYGLTNHPQTNTGTVAADWTVDNSVIRDDIRAMRSVLKNDNNYSPGGTGYWLYLGTEFYDTLDDADPEGSGDTTIRDRVENLANISAVRELDYLGSKEALMFRPTEDVIDVGVAAEVQPVMWEDPFRDYWAILGSVYPRVKTTLTNQSGIVHYTV